MKEDEPFLCSSSGGEAHTLRVAAALAGICRHGDCVKLHGDLGAGKTTFARGFIQARLLTPMEVVSPTFILVQTYPAQGGIIWHYDLYRLKDVRELDELGIDEALAQGITLMEWPELAERILPEDALNVTIAPGAHAGERRITLTGSMPMWQKRLKDMAL